MFADELAPIQDLLKHRIVVYKLAVLHFNPEFDFPVQNLAENLIELLLDLLQLENRLQIQRFLQSFNLNFLGSFQQVFLGPVPDNLDLLVKKHGVIARINGNYTHIPLNLIVHPPLHKSEVLHPNLLVLILEMHIRSFANFLQHWIQELVPLFLFEIAVFVH